MVKRTCRSGDCLVCPIQTHTLRTGRIVADKIRSLPQKLRAWAYFLDELTDRVTYRYGWLRINVDVSGSHRLHTFSVNWNDADSYGYIRITYLPLLLLRCAYIAHLATISYNKRLPRAERVNFGEGIRRFICCDLCDIQHVKFSREMTILVLKPFGLQFT